ncbi:MAG: hypothetical protein JXA78_05890 [Anaerolineales bacterium]|nr:hypothetical protein [Anaerolineales bacterium]
MKPLQAKPPDDDVLGSLGHPSAPDDTGDLGGDLPDWLDSLRKSDDMPPAASEEPSPDWLGGLRSQPEDMLDAEPASSAASGFADSGDEPEDWLRGILPVEATGESDAAGAADLGASPGEELDWLQRIGADSDKPADQTSENVPEWLSELEDASPDMEPASVPEWFTQEAQDRVAPGDARPEQLPEESDEIPDWLVGSAEAEHDWLAEEVDQQPAPSAAAQDEALPDWLTPLPEEESAPAAGRSAERVEAELPDWLSQEISEPLTPTAAQPAEEEELPDWLSGEGEPTLDWASQEVEEQAALAAAQPAEEEVELPDWLTSAEDEAHAWMAQESKEKVPPEAQPADEEAQLPDWLLGVEDETIDWLPQEAEELPSAAQPAEEAMLPDWLSGQEDEQLAWLSQAAEEKVPPSAMQPAEEEAELPDWLSSEKLPDWLAEEGAQGAVAAQGTAGAPGLDLTAGEGPADEDLDWLGELEAAFPEMPSGAQVASSWGATEAQEGLSEPAAAFDDALPGWFAQPEAESGGGESAAAKPLAGGEDLDIMPAELPSWLEAMRPVAAVGAAAGQDEEITKGDLVSAGPLAGLRGVLPAEPDVAQITKPPVYTVKLQVTDLQKSHADLLGQLLAMEGEPRPIPGKPVITTQRLLRLVIAALLILTILVPIVLDLSFVSAPPAPAEALPAAESLVAGVPQEGVVLVAIDYEPGLSGEMDAVAGPVLDQLMKRGIFLTLVSTRTTGPLQAERLLAQLTNLGAPQYAPGQQYLNLGYIPGGAMGLLGFAEAPRQVLPQAMSGENAWGNSDIPALLNVNSLADFALLIVATENPDTARFWIEQVQPKLNDKPLVMLISAQAEPMVRPYYEADPKQVQGLVSGLAAGASYAAQSGYRGAASDYWSAFSIGMWVAGLLIIVAGLVNALSAYLRRGKEGVEGERQT